MKKLQKLTALLLAFLMIAAALPMHTQAAALPMTIHSDGAKITVDPLTNTYTLTYAQDARKASLRFKASAGWQITLYADALRKQTVNLENNTLQLSPAQKETLLFAVCTRGNTTANYTLRIISPRSAITYKDRNSIADWALPYVDYCNYQGLGIIKGDADSSLRPQASLSRNEIALIAARILGTDCSLFPKANKIYRDDIATWAEQGVYAMTALGIVSGHKVTEDQYYYNGNDNVTREQVAKILVNVCLQMEKSSQTAEEIYKRNKEKFEKTLSTFADEGKISKWARPYVAVAVCYFGFLNGSKEGGKTYLHPSQNINRQEITVMAAREMGYSIDIALQDLLCRARDILGTASKYPTVLIRPMRNEYQLATAAYHNGSTKQKETAYLALNKYTDLILNPKIVYLSPSNQMTNPYTGINTNEGAQMQDVARLLKPMLEEMGFIVYIGDVKVPLIDRATEAKKLNADIYVAIHSNATGGVNKGEWQGSIVFHSNNKGSKQLAQSVSKHLSALTPTKDDGIKNDSLTASPYKEIYYPKMANVLVEVEFHDYLPYASWILNNKKEIAAAFANSILDYFLNY